VEKLTRFKPPGTMLTQRQWNVMRLRSLGLTQTQVAKRLRTTRENVTIIEHRAHKNLRAAKATLTAIEELSGSMELILPSGVSIFEATSMILRRADVLRIKVKMDADSILATLRAKRRGRIRGHHLIAVIKVKISSDGSLQIK
jgi:Tfx family DNA-binding protein